MAGELSDNKEFLSLLKNDFDLFSDSVYAFTPTGDVKTLPTGSNTIDLLIVFIVQSVIKW